MSDYINDEFNEYLNTYCSVRGLSVNTINSYKEDFKHLREYILSSNKTIYSITKEDAELFILDLINKRLTNVSINRILSSCRGFYKVAYRNKKINYNPFSGIKNTHCTNKLPTYLTTKEINDLINSSDNNIDNFLNLRNISILTLMYSTGARRAEIQSLNIDDLDFYNSQIIIKGKGNKHRIVYITNEAEFFLKQYIVKRNPIVSNKEKALFVNKNGNRLTLSSYNNIFSLLEKNSKCQKHITPHTIRHTFATELMNKGMDIRTLQELLGHNSSSTTGIYIHLSLNKLLETYFNTHPHA